MRRTTAVKTAAYRWGAATLFLAAAVILAALGFEHLGGYRPCPLCLQQRYAYYAGIPLLFVGLVLLSAERPRAASLVFLSVGFIFLANAGLGIYHAGAEWGFWPGPESCAAGAGPLTLDPNAPLQGAVRCDEAPWRFAGLSFAGWNAVFSVVLAMGAAQSAFVVRDYTEE